MNQAREEVQQQLKNPIRCPRCDSPDTRFRYFNNNSLTQPRHYCRTCKRQWTIGGRLRLIPIGGNTRNGTRTKASSSGGGNSRSQPPQTPLPLGERHRHRHRHQQNLPLMNAMVSQNFDIALFQPITSMPAAVSPFNYFSDRIYDGTQTLIQQVSNQHVNARNLFSRAGTNMAILQERNVQTMAPRQALSQQNPITFESYQTHNEAITAPPSHLYTNRVVQPAWPVNSLPRDITYDSSFTMSNACLQNNMSGDATNTEDTTYVNVDEWLNFPGSDPP